MILNPNSCYVKGRRVSDSGSLDPRETCLTRGFNALIDLALQLAGLLVKHVFAFYTKHICNLDPMNRSLFKRMHDAARVGGITNMAVSCGNSARNIAIAERNRSCSPFTKCIGLSKPTAYVTANFEWPPSATAMTIAPANKAIAFIRTNRVAAIIYCSWNSSDYSDDMNM